MKKSLTEPVDSIGEILLTGDPPWCAWVGELHLNWDQWAVCEITCSHGVFRGASGLLNLTEAVQSANEKFCAASHPAHCMQTFMCHEGGQTFELDCQRWEGHSGDHEIDEGESLPLTPQSGRHALWSALQDALRTLQELADYYGFELEKMPTVLEAQPTSGSREPEKG